MNGVKNVGPHSVEQPLAQDAPEPEPIQGEVRVPSGVIPDNIARKVEDAHKKVNPQSFSSMAPRISIPEEELKKLKQQQMKANMEAGLTEWMKKLKDEWGDVRGEPLSFKSPLLQTVAVGLPPYGRSIQIDDKMVRHLVAGVPEESRREAVENMVQDLQHQVLNGFRLCRDLIAGKQLNKQADIDDVRDLTTFLMTQAAAKGAAFRDGVFSIEDPGNRLRNFLDSCPGKYIHGEHCGIDFGDKDKKLPYGKGTVLYGAMKKGEGIADDRLFLTLKNHGPSPNLRSGFENSGRFVDRYGPGHFFRDVGRALGHTVDSFRKCLHKFSGGRLFSSTLESRTDSIPPDVVHDYRNLIKNFEKRGLTAFVTILRHNNPLSSDQGIRTMVKNLDQALNRIGMANEERPVLEQFRNKLSARFDHLEVRIGNEVVLNADELSGVKQGENITITKARGKSLQQAVDNRVRLMVTDLLKGGAGVTPGKVQKFVGNMVQTALHLQGQEDTNEIALRINNALKTTLKFLSPAELQDLTKLLASFQFKAIPAAARRLAEGEYDQHGNPVRGLSKMEADGVVDTNTILSATSIANKVADMYKAMIYLANATDVLNEPLEDKATEDTDLDTAKARSDRRNKIINEVLGDVMIEKDMQDIAALRDDEIKARARLDDLRKAEAGAEQIAEAQGKVDDLVKQIAEARARIEDKQAALDEPLAPTEDMLFLLLIKAGRDNFFTTASFNHIWGMES